MKFEDYLNTKGLKIEDLQGKGGEELAGIYNEFNEKKNEELKGLVESKASKEDIDSLKNELQETVLKQQKALNEALKEYGVAIKKLSNTEKSATDKPFTLKEALSLNIDKLKSLAGKDDINDARKGEFGFKAPADMLINTNVSGGNVPVEQRLSGLNTIPSRTIRLLDITARGTADSNVISWVYQANKDGAAGPTAEGAVKNQIDFDLVVDSESVKKFTAFIKVSDEMVDDISFMATEINNELMRELLKVVESQVYEGDGIGTNLNGIRTVATAFAAGSFAGTVDGANIVDVLRVAMDNIKVAEQGMPNYILMHPSDVTALKLVKVSTTDGRYIDQLQMVGGQLSLDGVPIIETTLVTIGDYLVGDFNLSTVYNKGSISIQVGLDGNDFTKNMRTVRAEWRGLVLVKNNDRTSFVKGDFPTDKAALETP